MSQLHFQGHTVTCRLQESVLDALVRAGLDIHFSCKSGICRRCMVRCVDGPVPKAASKKLPSHLQSEGYLLACQCFPEADMVLAPRSPEHMITSCMLLDVREREAVHPSLAFEPYSELDFHAGQGARLRVDTQTLDVELMSRDEQGAIIAKVVQGKIELARWLNAHTAEGDGFGMEFELQGPFPTEPAQEVQPPGPDPSLWSALDNGKVVRAVLETFYNKVYADPLLMPFFERVTMERVIGKQYAFLMQGITGESVYIGERPRNSHHWMVIADSLFDHRQRLMLDAQRAHGLSEALIERWSRYEEVYRPDIVKYAPWPRRIGDQVIETERYDSVTLDEANVCDHCGEEIMAGTEVRYHVRLGMVGCHTCTPTHAP